MSRSYALFCQSCERAIWIGQGWPPDDRYIYKTPGHIFALQSFLFAHEGHSLEFMDLDKLRAMLRQANVLAVDDSMLVEERWVEVDTPCSKCNSVVVSDGRNTFCSGLLPPTNSSCDWLIPVRSGIREVLPRRG